MSDDLNKLKKSIANIKKVLTKEPVKPIPRKAAAPVKTT